MYNEKYVGTSAKPLVHVGLNASILNRASMSGIHRVMGSLLGSLFVVSCSYLCRVSTPDKI